MPNTKCSEVYELFLNKISDFNFTVMDNEVRNRTIELYLRAACVEFRPDCLQDLTIVSLDIEHNCCGQVLEFKEELDFQVLNILSECMVVEWLKPKVAFGDNLENILNTPDFKLYSPANLLKQTRETLDFYQRNVRKLINEYSFEHKKQEDFSYGK